MAREQVVNSHKWSSAFVREDWGGAVWDIEVPARTCLTTLARQTANSRTTHLSLNVDGCVWEWTKQ